MGSGFTALFLCALSHAWLGDASGPGRAFANCQIGLHLGDARGRQIAFGIDQPDHGVFRKFDVVKFEDGHVH